MYNFAMIVRNNHRHFKRYASEVKVAIIDDGIDDRVPIFKERIAGGKSFLKKPDRQDRTIDYWIRPGGHGTQMAKLICHIFPYARLYIIRLDEGVGEKGERQIRIDSAIKVCSPLECCSPCSESCFNRRLNGLLEIQYISSQ